MIFEDFAQRVYMPTLSHNAYQMPPTFNTYTHHPQVFQASYFDRASRSLLRQVYKIAFLGSKSPQDAPRYLKMPPRWPQDAPKMTSRCPKMPQVAPKMAQDSSKMAQDSPRYPQDAPKMLKVNQFGFMMTLPRLQKH